jgi:hypothetical protein
MNKISFHGSVIPLKKILENPKFWSDRNLICFAVRDAWWESVKTYGREHRDELNSQRVTLEKFSGDWSEEAFRLFHLVRDRICEASGDTSRQYKEHIKDILKKEVSGERSIKDFTRKEMWLVTNKAIDMALEADADIRDFKAEFSELYREV